jgi:hypothetical protein
MRLIMSNNKSDYHKTVNGWQGYQIKKLIEFVLGQKPTHYKWDNEKKVFRFFIDKEAIEKTDRRKAWAGKIRKYIGIELIGI